MDEGDDACNKRDGPLHLWGEGKKNFLCSSECRKALCMLGGWRERYQIDRDRRVIYNIYIGLKMGEWGMGKCVQLKKIYWMYNNNTCNC